MDKFTEKQTIKQQTIVLNSIDAQALKEAIQESNFIDKVITQKTLSNLVDVSFNVNDFLLENESLNSQLEKSRLSLFFKGYYELNRSVINSKYNIENIDAELLKTILEQSKVIPPVIDFSDLLHFYTAVILLIDSMFQDEIAEPKEKSRIVAIISLYNDLLKALLKRVEL